MIHLFKRAHQFLHRKPKRASRPDGTRLRTELLEDRRVLTPFAITVYSENFDGLSTGNPQLEDGAGGEGSGSNGFLMDAGDNDTDTPTDNAREGLLTAIQGGGDKNLRLRTRGDGIGNKGTPGETLFATKTFVGGPLTESDVFKVAMNIEGVTDTGTFGPNALSIHFRDGGVQGENLFGVTLGSTIENQLLFGLAEADDLPSIADLHLAAAASVEMTYANGELTLALYDGPNGTGDLILADSLTLSSALSTFRADHLAIHYPGQASTDSVERVIDIDVDDLLVSKLNTLPNPVTFVVTTTADTSLPTDGVVSLREAIVAANVVARNVSITFEIPATDAGFVDVDGLLAGGDPSADVFQIQLDSPLPALDNAHGISIDGRTQTVFSGDTNDLGPEIVLLAPPPDTEPANGLELLSDGNFIAGLVIDGFDGDALHLVNSNNNVIVDNYLGIAAHGAFGIGNGQTGIRIQGGSGNRIGDAGPDSRNVISNHTGNAGVFLTDATTDNLVLGNYLGTNASGTELAGNLFGVRIIDSSRNLVGAASALAGNLISGNTGAGIQIQTTSGFDSVENLIQGNKIGTDASGTSALGNHDGIRIREGTNNQIGGAKPHAGNLISGNSGDGINISPDGSTGTIVHGNHIGTEVSGTTGLGNAGHGIVVVDSTDNQIGGVGSGQGNVIAHNVRNGVAVSSGERTSIRGNSIFENGELGIDLAGGGVTANDPLDVDTGANELQNFPTLILADANESRILGNLDSTPVTTFQVDFYASAAADPSAFGEGQRYLGSATVTTDGLGVANINQDFPSGYSVDEFITATATDPSGNTSEFSAAIAPLRFDTIVYSENFDGRDTNNPQLEDGAGGGGSGSNGFLMDGGDNDTDTPTDPTLEGLLTAVQGDGDQNLRLRTRRDGSAPDPVAETLFATQTFLGGPLTEDDIFQFSMNIEGIIAPDDAGTQLLDIRFRDGGALGTNLFGIVFGSVAGSSTNLLYGIDGLNLSIFQTTANAESMELFYAGNDLTLTLYDGPDGTGNEVGTQTTSLDPSLASFRADRIAVHYRGDTIGDIDIAVDDFLIRSASKTLLVTTTADSGPGSLRQAIEDANAALGADGSAIPVSIFFDIDASEAVDVDSALPGGDPEGDVFQIQLDSPLPALTNPRGIAIDGRTQTFFGGDTNTSGPEIQLLGDGTEDVHGLRILSTDANFVAGLAIDGFAASAINIESGNNNEIVGNFINVGATGDVSTVAGDRAGIEISRGSGNRIGDAGAESRNIISNNSVGVLLTRGTSDNLILNNYIGTDASGTVALENEFAGVRILDGASQNFVGAASSGAGNVISANGRGIQILDVVSTQNKILGNKIGTDATGTSDLGNTGIGIELSGDAGPNNQIGDDQPFGVNLISGNDGDGIRISSASATGTTIQRNLIGTDISGRAILGNDGYGIEITGPGENLIGGRAPDAGNTIGGNTLGGIRLTTSDNIIHGNSIGVSPPLFLGGLIPLPNGGNGVLIEGGVQGNAIGSLDFLERNVIAHNTGHGVSVLSGQSTSIRGNSIFDNDGLGISIDPIVPSPDLPVLTLATVDEFRVIGTMTGAPFTTYQIDVFASPTADPSGFGEGRLYQGTTNVTTDANGDGAIDQAFPFGFFFNNGFITATATDPNGNTSEFSAALAPRLLTTTVYSEDFDGLDTSNPQLEDGLGGEGSGSNGFLMDGGDNDTDDGNNDNDPALPDPTFEGLFTAVTSVAGSNDQHLRIRTDRDTFPPAPDVETLFATRTFAGGPLTESDEFRFSMNIERIAIGNRTSSNLLSIRFRQGGEGGTDLFGVNLGSIFNSDTSLRYQVVDLQAGNPGLGETLEVAADRLELLYKDGELHLTLFDSSGSVVGGDTHPLGAALSTFSADRIAIHYPSGDSTPRILDIDVDDFLITKTSETIFVTTTADSGPGSLRQAIEDANGALGVDGSAIPVSIFFDIPGAESVDVDSALPGGDPGGDVFQIQLDDPLPALTNPRGIAIDGRTQTSFGGNTNANGPEIVLLAPPSGSEPSNGLELLSDRNFVAGLVIDGFDGDAIHVDGGSHNVIVGNYLGLDATGMAGIGNGQGGITIHGGSDNQVGGTEDEYRNVISNNQFGVHLTGGTTGNVIQNNYIGTDASSTARQGNVEGVRITSGTGNQIGGIGSRQSNVIAHNSGAGVAVTGGDGNSIRGNVIFENGGLGIDLADDGVTANDAGDNDTGPNLLQNFPVLDLALSTAQVAGTLSGPTFTDFEIDVYASTVADPSGFGAGMRYLGTTTARTDSTGNAVFDDAFLAGFTDAEFITATATDAAGNTSEFSQAITPLLIELPNTVYSEDFDGLDTGNPQLEDGPEGEGSGSNGFLMDGGDNDTDTPTDPVLEGLLTAVQGSGEKNLRLRTRGNGNSPDPPAETLFATTTFDGGPLNETDSFRFSMNIEGIVAPGNTSSSDLLSIYFRDGSAGGADLFGVSLGSVANSSTNLFYRAVDVPAGNSGLGERLDLAAERLELLYHDGRLILTLYDGEENVVGGDVLPLSAALSTFSVDRIAIHYPGQRSIDNVNRVLDIDVDDFLVNRDTRPNTPPVLDPIGNRNVDEGSLLTFTTIASDPDLPAGQLTFSLDPGAPAGASIDPLSGVFTWTPSEVQGPGDFEITVRVSDDGTPSLDDFETFTITVNEVNVAPVLDPIGNQTADELETLSFTATATDTDDPANALTFRLEDGAAGLVPAGATITPNGDFSWTPTEAQGPESFTFDLVVTDDGSGNLSDRETITITVNEVNVAPVLDPIGDQTVNELETLSFTATATDTDDPANALTFRLEDGAGGLVPTGASISADGNFSWTPSEAQGPGSFTFDVVVTDDGSPNLSDRETIIVTVDDVNVAPVLDQIGNQTVDELTELTFTATASDGDGSDNTLTFSLDPGAPAEASIDPLTGLFTWTPGEAQGPGDFEITVRISDDGNPSLDDFKTITITVNEVNVAPVLDPIGNKSVNELAELTFTATANDTDVPANGLTFSLDAGAPADASITSDGVFSWTPTETQGSDVFEITVRVTDDGNPGLEGFETFTVTVHEVNTAPVMAPIDDKTVNELETLSFTATATDTDDPANTLTFRLDENSLSAGMTIDPLTGEFTWTPNAGQGPGVFPVTITVTDDGSPNLSDAKTFDISVGDVNIPPVLDPIGDKTVDELTELTFTATASDPDLPADQLTFSLDPGAPAGASIVPLSGVFTWTPIEAQGPGEFEITVRVTDDGNPSLDDFETFTVTVHEVNDHPPVLDLIGDRSVDELTVLTFTATASGADLPANGLTFSLDAGAPDDARITSDGLFSWTPSEAQGPGDFEITVRVTDDGNPSLDDFETFTVTVNEVNVAPILDPIGDQTVDENSLLSFTATASDADLPANGLTFSLDAGAPEGASITSDGLFTWTPTAAQGPGIFEITVRVRDDGAPRRDDVETFTVAVNEVNVAPVLEPIGDKNVDERQLLFFTATAADSNAVFFSLEDGDTGSVPAGATIDPGTGAFNWTPTEAQGRGSFTFDVVVTDNGSPNLSDRETITVAVNEINVAPVLDPISNQTIIQLTELSFTATASDTDEPANTLTFGLDDGTAGSVPAGAVIDPTSGVFRWTPTELQGLGSFTFDVVVTDDGSPTLADRETISVMVTAPVTSRPDLVAESDSGISDVDDITNENRPSFTVDVDAGSTVELFSNQNPSGADTPLLTTVDFDTGIITVAQTLSDGTHVITAVETDSSGQSKEASSPLVLIVDTTRPGVPDQPDLADESDTFTEFSTGGGSQTIMIGSDDDDYTNDTTPTFHVMFPISTEPGTLVSLFVDGALVGDDVPESATPGTWSTTLDALTPTDGDPFTVFSITARSKDVAGNESVSQSTALEVTIDTSPPTSTVQLVADSDELEPDENADDIPVTADATPTFQGEATESGDGPTVIRVGIQGAFNDAFEVDSTGTWSATVAPPLPDDESGSSSFEITIGDLAGNLGLANQRFIIDATASQPKITRLDTDSGSVVSNDPTRSDRITNVALPLISGRKGDGPNSRTDKIQLFSDRQGLIGETSVQTNSWTIQVDPDLLEDQSGRLQEGVHLITAVAIGVLGGNPSPPSDPPFVITIDTTVDPPEFGLSPDTDSGVNGDGITNVRQPTLFGTSEVSPTPGAATRIELEIDRDNDGTIDLTRGVVADESGNWTFGLFLPEGTHSITASATDIAGNVSAASDAFLLTIDATAVVPTDLALHPDANPVSTEDPDAFITKDLQPTIIGRGAKGDTITLFSNQHAGEIGQAIVDDSGVWEIQVNVPLDDGVTYTFTARSLDLASNDSEPSNPPLVVTIDAFSRPPTMNLAFDTGRDMTDGLTNVAEQIISGTADPSSNVELTLGDGSTITVTADEEGNWTTPAPSDPPDPNLVVLVDGPQTITAVATDPAGNVSEQAFLEVTLDTTKPAAPTELVLRAGSDTGVSDSDGVTMDIDPDFIVATDLEADVVELRVNVNGENVLLPTRRRSSQTIGDRITHTVQVDPPLDDGTYVIRAVAVDEAGNASDPSEEFVTVTIDTTEPAQPELPDLISDDGVSDSDNVTSIRQPTFTVELPGAETTPEIDVTLRVDGDDLLPSAVTVDGSEWTFVVLDDMSFGVHVITAIAADRAGNERESTELTVEIVNLDRVVTTAVDENDGLGAGTGNSLREVIADINATAAEAITAGEAPIAETIRFELPTDAPRITLDPALGTLFIDAGSDVAILGPDADELTIAGDLSFTLFAVDATATAEIAGLTLAGGDRAVENAGMLTVTDSTLDGVFIAPDGEEQRGGGIVNTAVLTVERSYFVNSSGSQGGAIHNTGAATISASTFAENSASDGGAIFNSDGGQLTVENSTFSNNIATSFGGAIRSKSGNSGQTPQVILTHSTITDNHAGRDGSFFGSVGGGISFVDSRIELHNSIVAGNTGTSLFSGAVGGGSGGGVVPPIIVIPPLGIGFGAKRVASDIDGTVDGSSSFNVIGEPLDVSGIDPAEQLGNQSLGNSGSNTTAEFLLGPLANNGGPTPTHALVAGSLAIDAGGNVVGLATDQRGFARVDGSVDIGAVEFFDADSDGVDDETEKAGPNGGDGNGDETLDSQQANVASLPNAVDGSFVTVVAPEGTALQNVIALPDPEQEGREFPIGVFQFELTGVTGDAAEVTLILEEPVEFAGPFTYFKSVGDELVEFPEVVFIDGDEEDSSDDDGLIDVIRLTLSDNDAFDTNPDTGTIGDPGGPALIIPVVLRRLDAPDFAVTAQPVTAATSLGPDAVGTFTAQVDWGDGLVEPLPIENVDGTDVIVDTHDYATTGSYLIRFSITDESGNVTSVEQQVQVESLLVATVAEDPTQQIIIVGGTDQSDRIEFKARNHGRELDVKVNGERLGRFDAASISRVIAFGGQGNDHISLSNSLDIDAIFHGGAGNDLISGGRGDDILVGSDGHDILLGHLGRDILIGGRGLDLLLGGLGHDLHIQRQAPNEDDLAALDAALAHWLDDDRLAALGELGMLSDDHEFCGGRRYGKKARH